MQNSAPYQIFSEKWYSKKALKELEASSGLRAHTGRFTRHELATLKAFIPTYLASKPDGAMTMAEFQETLRSRSINVLRDLGLKELYIKATQLLASGRSVAAVYYFIRRKFHPDLTVRKKTVKQTTEDDAYVDADDDDAAAASLQSSSVEGLSKRSSEWTEDMDKALLTAVAEAGGTKWEAIAPQLGMTPMACLHRWRVIKHGSRVVWTPQLDARLLDAIQDARNGSSPRVSHADDSRVSASLKDLQPDAPFWNRVAALFGPPLTPLQAIHRYYGRLCSNDHFAELGLSDHEAGLVDQAQVDRTLVQRIADLGFLTFEEIDWKLVGDFRLFPSFARHREPLCHDSTDPSKHRLGDATLWHLSPPMLHQRFVNLRKRVPSQLVSLDDVIQYLLRIL